MRHAFDWALRHRGPLVGLFLAAIGVGLIAADRVAAARAGDRRWLSRDDLAARRLASRRQPWPQWAFDRRIGELAPFSPDHVTTLSEVAAGLSGNVMPAHLEIDQLALIRAGIGVNPRVRADRAGRPLADVLDHLVASVTDVAGRPTPLAWTLEPDHTILISSPAAIAVERRLRQQRADVANPDLRRALDRRIPYVRFDTSVADALRHCERIGSVKIVVPDDTALPDTNIEAYDVTCERMVELILRRTSNSGPGPALRFKAAPDHLIVFIDPEAP